MTPVRLSGRSAVRQRKNLPASRCKIIRRTAVRINGLLSFHIIFQCKKNQGVVNSSQIRDFRGAMQGRSDKGLFITTGTFTRDAIKEATREGAPPIDLMDGEQLIAKLRELSLGVNTKIIQTELVEIDYDWFQQI